MTHPTSGQTNLTAIAILLGTVITAVWVWKRLSLDTQDYLIDQAIPIALLAVVCLVIVWLIVRAVRGRQQRLRRREMLLARFTRETASDKRLETAFALVEVNNYRLGGSSLNCQRSKNCLPPRYNGRSAINSIVCEEWQRAILECYRI